MINKNIFSSATAAAAKAHQEIVNIHLMRDWTQWITFWWTKSLVANRYSIKSPLIVCKANWSVWRIEDARRMREREDSPDCAKSLTRRGDERESEESVQMLQAQAPSLAPLSVCYLRSNKHLRPAWNVWCILMKYELKESRVRMRLYKQAICSLARITHARGNLWWFKASLLPPSIKLM